MDFHEREYQQFRWSVREYLTRYYIGHYTLLGNMFCALALKPKLIEMLDPKPPPYRDDPDLMD